MSTSLSSLSIQQLRKAATLKEKIQLLEKELGKILGAATQLVASVVPKKKRKLSAAGRAAIRAAVKARWARQKGQKVSAKPAPKSKGKMSAAAKARISAAMKARWAKVKAKKK